MAHFNAGCPILYGQDGNFDSTKTKHPGANLSGVKKTIQQRLDWLYKNQPHNIEAINALLLKLPAKSFTPHPKAPRKPDQTIPAVIQSQMPQVDFKESLRQRAPTLSKNRPGVPEPWDKQPDVLSAFQSFAQRFIPGSDPFSLYSNGCPVAEFMGFCLFLKTVALP